MITLNLLLPTKKKELKREIITISMYDSFLILTLFAAFLCLLILGAYFLLQENYQQFIELQTTPSVSENRTELDVLTVNQKLQRIKNIQKEFLRTTPILIQLTESIPEKIQLSELRIKDRRITLRGTAETRDALILLKNELEKNPSFQNFDFPIQNLTKKENIDFRIEFMIVTPSFGAF